MTKTKTIAARLAPFLMPLAAVLSVFFAAGAHAPTAAQAAVNMSTVAASGNYLATAAQPGFQTAAQFSKVAALQTTNNSWANNKITSLASGTDAADAINYNELLNPFKVLWISEEFAFLASSTASTGQFYANLGGAGSGVTNVLTGMDSTHMGVWQTTTGTTATGRAALLTTPTVNNIIFGSVGQVEWDWLIQLPTLSSTGVQQYIGNFGVHDTVSTATVANGVYFRYDGATSANWQFCTALASTSTCTATSTAVTAGAWVRLGAIKAEGSLNWTGYINGATTGITNSTNLPGSATLQPIAAMVSSVGGTGKVALHDAFRLKIHFATERGP